jgi:hypothetical protein
LYRGRIEKGERGGEGDTKMMIKERRRRIDG